MPLKGTDYTAGRADPYLKALTSGEIGVAQYAFVQSMRGNVYYIGSADVSTPTTWTAAAAIDITLPVLHVSVPASRVLIPLHIELYMEAFGTNAQFECQAVSGTGGSRTSGGTAITPVNLRTDKTDQSGLVCYAGGNSILTVGQTANINVFWRDGKQFAITKTAESATVSSFDPCKFVWDAVLNNTFVLCGGGSGAQLQVNQGSQAGTGFVKLIGIVIPNTDLP